MDKQDLSEEVLNTFHWILSEYWDILVLAKLGYHDMLEDKMEALLGFLKANGITEESMSLEGDINKEALINLINQFVK